MSELERKDTTQETAAGLTSDIRAVYGLKNLKNMFNRAIGGGGGKPAAPVTAPGTYGGGTRYNSSGTSYGSN